MDKEKLFAQIKGGLIVIDGRVPSILIAGGGNFPVRKRKSRTPPVTAIWASTWKLRSCWIRSGLWVQAGSAPTMTLPWKSWKKKLAGLEELQATMKSVNAYYRKHKTLRAVPACPTRILAGCNPLWRMTGAKTRCLIPLFLLTNNNANIRRVRQRIDDLKNRSEFVGWTFPGGEAKINEAENRLQLLLMKKPPEDQRRALKSEGFKWAPSQGAWQRQLNQNAIRAAARLDFLRPEDDQSPYQLQPLCPESRKGYVTIRRFYG